MTFGDWVLVIKSDTLIILKQHLSLGTVTLNNLVKLGKLTFLLSNFNCLN